MACCGPKLSLCLMILSVWGAVQLGLMGVFYYIKSVAFLEDVDVVPAKNVTDIDRFYKDLDDAYTQGAYNCWIAAGLYVILMLVAAQQFRASTRI